ncbi:uncharacterized protein BDW43DRAFT_281638 [Aspergillus alliaceus]|uniref:uncharacterized protein n=1 Tax=Petromyces alliaceus TaxID=209559 RepID=UPI0012A4DD39|nr:uncharacterized protein BDW43DRAFT_281638 [Aspergillus alliaceus]KAB8231791.1 hypothetical protein BDW43DRAFT_281638 [Aspergillus alliaceus]
MPTVVSISKLHELMSSLALCFGSGVTGVANDFRGLLSPHDTHSPCIAGNASSFPRRDNWSKMSTMIRCIPSMSYQRGVSFALRKDVARPNLKLEITIPRRNLVESTMETSYCMHSDIQGNSKMLSLARLCGTTPLCGV